jgi:hypothetical protein
MWRFSAYFLVAFGATLFAVGALNAALDPNHSFGLSLASEGRMAGYLVAGEDVATGRTLNMHVVHKYQLNESAKAPDVVVLGSSRVWELGQWLFPGRRLLNAGTGSATLADYIAMWGLFEDAEDKSPKTLVLGADPWIFNRQHPSEQQCRQLADEFARTERAMGGASIDECARFVRYRDLFSLTRLRTAVQSEYFLRFVAGMCGHLVPAPATSIPVGRGCDLWHADGSMNHFAVMSEAALEAFTREQGVSGRFKFFDGMTAIDPALVADFRHLIAHIQQKGVRVVVYLSPFNPSYIQGIRESHPNDLQLLAEIESTIRQLAADLSAPVYGSYWPDSVPCRSDEYYDSIHAQPSCIEKITVGGVYRKYKVEVGDFVHVVGALSPDGDAPSAFATEGARSRISTHARAD